MNYSEFKLDDNENCVELSKITSNDAQGILEDFEILNKNLDEFKKKIDNLQAHKIHFDNYISSLQNNHLNIMNIINDYNIQDNNNELNQLFINYNNKMKNDYEKWIIQYYNIKLLEFENTIDIIEKKIIEFRTLFIYIINKITKSHTDDKKMCPICFENEVDICINPCDHTLCNKCVISTRNRYTIDKCYSCRGLVHDHIKIYFSL